MNHYLELYIIPGLCCAPAHAIDLSQNQRWTEKSRVFAGQDENAGKPLLKLGIILPQTQWLTKIRSYLNIISNSLEDLDQVKVYKIKCRILYEYSFH